MSKRLCVLGLDGLGLSAARDLVARGVMPHLGGLLARGQAWGLDTPLPELSPVCWTSLFSGQGPGAHGIYGFASPEPGSYGLHMSQSPDVRAPRIWDTASAKGLYSVVLNVPLTFPASKIKGIMVSGFVCLDLERGVHPPDWLPRLRVMGYRPEPELEAGRADSAAFMQDLLETLKLRLAMFQRMVDEPWDLYIAVVTESDRINHFLWPALSDDSHPQAGQVLEAFGLMDQFIGLLWQRLEPAVDSGETALLICADHGFGPVQSEVYLNPWLREMGWLKVEGEPPHERILPGTCALALDPGRIYLHWAGRFPHGHLRPGPEADAITRNIKDKLLAVTYPSPGSPVRPVARVHLKQELYHGPFLDQAPDLVAQASPGFSLRAKLDQPGIFGRSHITGTHQPTDALALWLGGPVEDMPLNIADLHPIMVKHLGLVSADLP